MTISNHQHSNSFRRNHIQHHIHPLSSPPLHPRLIHTDNDDTDGSDHTCIRTSRLSKLGSQSSTNIILNGSSVSSRTLLDQDQQRSALAQVTADQQRHKPGSVARERLQSPLCTLDSSNHSNHTNMTNARKPERPCYSPAANTSRSWADRNSMITSKSNHEVSRGCKPISVSTTALTAHRRSNHVSSSSNRFLRNGKSAVDITHTKLYRTRINSAARTIQKMARGIQARQQTIQLLRQKYRRDAAVLIQTRVRIMLAKQYVQKIQAIIPIQALYRGYHYRVTSQIPRLEMRLERIEQVKKRELLQIQTWKKREMKRIREQCYEQIAKTKAERKENKKVFRETELIANKCFAENKRLEEQNESLQKEIDALVRENELLTKQSKNQSYRTQELKEIMNRVNEESEVLIKVASKLKTKIRSVQRKIDKQNELIVMDKRLGNKYLITLQTMALTLGDQCDDDDLVIQVEKMCLQCDKWRGKAVA